MSVTVQREAFDPTEEYQRLLAVCPGAALVTFTGYVRDIDEQADVAVLELEHYPGMTERVLADIGAQAEQQFGLQAWRVVHRYGRMAVSDPIVWVGTVAPHRGAAFDGCHFMMDALKTDAPFWKKTYRLDGSSDWVAAKSEDDLQRQRWRNTRK